LPAQSNSFKQVNDRRAKRWSCVDQFIDIGLDQIGMERSSSCCWSWPMAGRSKALASYSDGCAVGPWVESQTRISRDCALKLNKRRKDKRRLPTRNPAPLQVSQTMNECWSADFMSDALWDGSRFRTFNVV
jgi:hypothetical protein